MEPTARRGAGGGFGSVIEGLAVLEQHDLLSEFYPRVVEAASTENVIPLVGFHQCKKAGGIAAAACEKLDEAEAFYEAALKEAADIPIRLEQAEVRRWYAKMLLGWNGEGDRDKARQLIREASRYTAPPGCHVTLRWPRSWPRRSRLGDHPPTSTQWQAEQHSGSS